MAGQSSWGSGMPLDSGCTDFIEEKEARLSWARVEVGVDHSVEWVGVVVTSSGSGISNF